MRKIDNLTGIRGIAALWVFFGHYQSYFMLLLGREIWPINKIFQYGYFGVDLFFLLSGFILAYVYYEELNNSYSMSKIKNFFLKRFARIYPVFLVTTLIATFFWLVALRTQHQFTNESSQNLNWLNFIANIIGVQAWFNLPSLNGPAWSVSAEFAAYLIFPLLVLVLFRVNRFRDTFLIASLILCGAFYQVGLWSSFSNFNMLRLFTEFIAGVCCFVIFENKLVSDSFAKVVRMSATLVLILAFLMIESELFLKSVVPFFLLSIVVANFYCNTPGKGLSRKTLLTLGIWSYSLYLTHRLFQNIMSGLDFPIYQSPSYLRFLQMIVLLTVPILTAGLVTRFIEHPMRLLIIKRFDL